MQRERALTCVLRGTRTEVGTAGFNLSTHLHPGRYPWRPAPSGPCRGLAGGPGAKRSRSPSRANRGEARTGTPRRLAYVCVFDPDRLRHGDGQLRTRRRPDHCEAMMSTTTPCRSGPTTRTAKPWAAGRHFCAPSLRRSATSTCPRRAGGESAVRAAQPDWRAGRLRARPRCQRAALRPPGQPDRPAGRVHVPPSLGDPIRAGRAACCRLVPEPGCRRELPFPAWTARDRAIRCSRWSGSASSSSPSASSTATRR